MSTASMNSSPSTARSSRPLFGVDTTGLPAIVISARTWPSPGVSISSARQATGSSPNASSSPRTRLCQRPSRTPRPWPGVPVELRWPAAASVNIAPPSRSRLPVSTLSTSTSQLACVPNSWVVVPMRAYTAACSARGELARHPPDLVGGDAGGGRHLLGRVAEHQLAELVEALAVLRQRPRVHQRLLDERARHGGEQQRVAAGPDEVVLVGLVGGAGPARVHHHDLAAALADRRAGGRACWAR